MWFKGDQFPSSLVTESGIQKRKKVNGYEGDVKGEHNVKKSNTRKSCKSSLQKKNNRNKNQERISCRFTDKNSCSYGDQADSESDDWERFSNFVDSELISDSIHDDWIPKLVIITKI